MRWTEPQPVKVSSDLREAVGGHPLVAETLVRRGYTSVQEARAFLSPDAYHPTAPEALPGMNSALDRIEQALARRELICVWGDFDVDGQTATTVLVSTLLDLGGDVIYHIPVREVESHGVRRPWLDQVLAKGVRLLLTCDTGIDAADAVSYARSQGVDVIITDHHELPAVLPEATALVNPHFLPAGHPLAALPGVGVAYKLAEALYLRAARPHPARNLLDLVALGIVADVAVQKGDTRYLLQRGLRVLQQTERLGLRELLRVAGVIVERGRENDSGLDLPAVDEETIGFVLAPRLNAIGRLGDANSVVELLTTTDLTRARILASQLEALNDRRKRVCDQVYAAAEARLERDPALLTGAALVLADPMWPAGVIGIVANRLVDKYHLPAVLLSTPPGELARGSARSIAGCHITEAIATQGALLEGFGGHEMAAGLSLKPEHIDGFRRGLERAIAKQLPGGKVEPELEIHGVVALSELSLSLILDLQRLAPFGAGNEPLILATRDVAITGQRPLGRDRHHLRLTVEDQHKVERQLVWWNWRGMPVPEGRSDVAFTARVQEYRGEVEVQLVWRAARTAAGVTPVVGGAAEAEIEVVDHRGCVDSLAVLEDMHRTYPWMTIWAEGPSLKALRANHRFMLGPADTLVIWSCPPGVEVLQAVLRRVAPSRVVMMGCDCDEESPRAFLEQLAARTKFAIRVKGGRVDPAELAAVLGHREVTVRRGLSLLEAQGMFAISRADDLSLRLTLGATADPGRLAGLRKALLEALAETLSYRRYYLRADKDRLIAHLASPEPGR